MKKMICGWLGICLVFALAACGVGAPGPEEATTLPEETTVAEALDEEAYLAALESYGSDSSTLEQAFLPLKAAPAPLTDDTVLSFFSYLSEICYVLSVEHGDAEQPPQMPLTLQVSNSEGGKEYVPYMGAITKGLDGKVSAACNRWLGLIAAEVTEPAFGDAAILISEDDLLNRVIQWDAFAAEYPEYVKKLGKLEGEEHPDLPAALGYGLAARYFRAYLCGLDNTPPNDYETNNLRTELQLSYERFLADPANQDYHFYESVKKVYRKWSNNWFKFSEDIYALSVEEAKKFSK